MKERGREEERGVKKAVKRPHAQHTHTNNTHTRGPKPRGMSAAET